MKLTTKIIAIIFIIMFLRGVDFGGGSSKTMGYCFQCGQYEELNKYVIVSTQCMSYNPGQELWLCDSCLNYAKQYQSFMGYYP